MSAFPPVPGADWAFFKSLFTLPTGDTSGNGDANLINGKLAAGKPVWLVPGQTYFVNQPINAWKTGSVLAGGQWWSASPADNYGTPLPSTQAGAVIVATSSFPNFSYVFDLVNSAAGVQQYGVDISGVNVYGWNIPGATPNVGLIGSTADVLDLNVDGTTGKVPDDWQFVSCKFSGSLNGAGVVSQGSPDCWWVDCESSEHKLDCWKMAFGTNSRFSNCKAENSQAGNGWHFTGQGVDNITTLTGCTSQFNHLDGWLFDDTAGAGTGLGTYQLTGCASTHDNQAAGTSASFDVQGCKSRVMGTGCVGTGSAFGARQAAGAYYTQFTGSILTGTTAATQDSGTNTHPLANTSPVAF